MVHHSTFPEENISEGPHIDGVPTPSARPPAPRVREALGLFGATLLLLIVVGGATQRLRPGPLGVAITELLAILLPALLWSRARRHRVLTRLGLFPLGGPQLLSLLLGGLLVGAAWFYLISLGIEPLLERLVPLPERERRQLLSLLLPPSGPRPLWQDLACFAAAPALCEEVLFRGVLLPILTAAARRLMGTGAGGLAGLLVTSLLFGAFHISPAKVLPTAVLGLGFGLVVLLTGALWPAIAMHFANNALVVLLVRAGYDEPPRPATSGQGLAFVAAAGAAALLGAGLLLLRPAPRQATTGGGAELPPPR